MLKTKDINGVVSNLKRFALITPRDGRPLTKVGWKWKLGLHLKLDVWQRAKALVGARVKKLSRVWVTIIKSS